jgi:hypothetical protein
MNLLDLPDEMLLSIFSQCTAVDAFSTFIGLHPRLDRIVCDPMLVRHLNVTVKTWQGEIVSISDQVTDRVCDTILPRINDRITKLTLEPHTMERVLCSSIDYPNLSSLSLVNFPRKTITQHLTGKISEPLSMNVNAFLL